MGLKIVPFFTAPILSVSFPVQAETIKSMTKSNYMFSVKNFSNLSNGI